MTKRTQSKPAVIADRKAAAPVSPAVGSKSIKGIATAAKDYRKAGATLLTKVQVSVLALGCALTSEQWDKQFKEALTEAFTEQGFTSADVMASKYKFVALALASGLPQFKIAHMGQTFTDYLAAVREPLRTAVLKDGRSIFPVKGEGKAPSGPKPTTAKAKAAAKAKREADKKAALLADAAKGSAGVARDAEGGLDVSRYAAIATSLMGSEAGGKLLLAILTDHRAAFDVWAKDKVAKAIKTDKPAKPAKPEEPSKDDKNLAAELLAMANKTEPARNGAAAK